MADLAGVFRKPFAYQVAAFRLRLADLRPTSVWTDLWQAEHDRAFMVAGAAKADLLADLGAAVDRAIAEGTGIEAFRRDFRAIVERRGWHGWTGEGTKGGEAWRTMVIYKTNMSVSYAAGRWAQLVEAGYPYLVYRHGGSLEPRPQHLSWDGLILPIDHPFWVTHAPPNGWGCSCYVVGARSRAAAVHLGGQPDKTLPDGWQALSPKTGAPAGIDKGWAYAPGASVAQDVAQLARKLSELPAPIAEALAASLPVSARVAMLAKVQNLVGLSAPVAAALWATLPSPSRAETMEMVDELVRDPFAVPDALAVLALLEERADPRDRALIARRRAAIARKLERGA